MRTLTLVTAGLFASWATWCCHGAEPVSSADDGTRVSDQAGPPEPAAEQSAAQLDWMDDYSEAMQKATEEQKMLLIYFENTEPRDAHQRFRSRTLSDPAVTERLRQYVRLRLPVTATISVDGQSQRLLNHRSFYYMYGRSGLAVIDLKDKEQPYYGHVVSAFPFDPPAYYCPNYESAASVKTILDLPPGTVTERTMIYAVRMHPERPASTAGQANPVLQEAAAGHSQYQARVRLLGHQGWEGRFQRIWSRLRGGTPPSEVCAESWPGSNLVTACIDCVHSWRQSPGHWRAVRARQPAFGYDIRRGTNGVWYATGIFGG